MARRWFCFGCDWYAPQPARLTIGLRHGNPHVGEEHGDIFISWNCPACGRRNECRIEDLRMGGTMETDMTELAKKLARPAGDPEGATAAETVEFLRGSGEAIGTVEGAEVRTSPLGGPGTVQSFEDPEKGYAYFRAAAQRRIEMVGEAIARLKNAGAEIPVIEDERLLVYRGQAEMFVDAQAAFQAYANLVLDLAAACPPVKR